MKKMAPHDIQKLVNQIKIRDKPTNNRKTYSYILEIDKNVNKML